MNDNFNKLILFGSFVSKSYAKDILNVLYTYQDVSASEAASRLGLHINTVQEFLEAMYKSDIISREEVSEKKRPYFRYKLSSNKFKFELDLDDLFREEEKTDLKYMKIREDKNSPATFKRAKSNTYFSSVLIMTGEGRERKEKRINLTNDQGIFLYNLPFPDGKFQSITDIMKKANVTIKNFPEILDIVNLLIEYRVIEEMK
jgi:predicted transcriptional regulator